MRQFLLRLSGVLILSSAVCGCSSLRSAHDRNSRASSASELARLNLERPLTPREAELVLNAAKESVVYGPSLGDVTLKVVSGILFPPYGIYLLGRGGWEMVTGTRAPEVTDILPDKDKEMWDATYDDIVSAPGRVSAALAGKEFKTKDRVESDWAAVVDEVKKNRGICDEKTRTCNQTGYRKSYTVSPRGR
jgi:hypothetical protein